MVEVVQNAPNLNMIRLVIEDMGLLLGIWNPADYHTNIVLSVIEKFSLNLQILAISVSPNMTSSAFISLLENSKISTLDLHCAKETGYGSIDDDDFIEDVLCCKHSLTTLNMFGQSSISCDFLEDFFYSKSSAKLKSICLDNIPLTRAVITAIWDSPNDLERVSIVDCLSDDEAIDIIGNSPSGRFKQLYCNQAVEHDDIKLSDGWFMDERLDIFSLWGAAITDK